MGRCLHRTATSSWCHHPRGCGARTAHDRSQRSNSTSSWWTAPSRTSWMPASPSGLARCRGCRRGCSHFSRGSLRRSQRVPARADSRPQYTRIASSAWTCHRV
eukprot:7386642-Prymnesium_polylepis.5